MMKKDLKGESTVEAIKRSSKGFEWYIDCELKFNINY
jgi:hypothetical protein